MKPISALKTGGRKADFNRKLVEGLPLSEAVDAAIWGDVVLTEGGKLGSDYIFAAVGCRHFPGPENDAKRNAVLLRISNALIAGKSNVFRQLADYLDARRRVHSIGGGPADKVLVEVGNYIMFCLYVPPQAGGWDHHILEIQEVKNPLLAAVWKKPSFTPSVKEIHVYLCQTMTNPPDYSTVERIVRVLGIKARPRRPRSKSAINLA